MFSSDSLFSFHLFSYAENKSKEAASRLECGIIILLMGKCDGCLRWRWQHEIWLKMIKNDKKKWNKPTAAIVHRLSIRSEFDKRFVCCCLLAFSPFLFISRHFIYISYKYPCYACRSTLYKNLFNIFFNFFLFEKIEFHVYWLISM